MTKPRPILALLVALCLSLALPGCNEGNKHSVEVEQLKADLAKVQSERDSFKRNLDSITKERDKMKTKVDELIESRGKLEVQINGLAAARDSIQKQFVDITASRSQWQEQVDDLTKAREDAVATAKAAQTQIDGLKTQLEASTQRVTQLENQFKQVQAAMKTLQEKTNF